MKRSKLKPPQHQFPPGQENLMHPLPQIKKPNSKGSGKLLNKVAIVTGGDSGIGRAVAVDFAKEGADVVIVYLIEHEDALKTQQLIQREKKKCLLIYGDIGEESFCEFIVKETIKKFKKIDILVNNAGEQHPQPSIEKITEKQLLRTFRTNCFSLFFMTKAALPYLKKTKGVIINTTSITAYKGHETLIDYSATKGAVTAFTRSLSLSLAKHKIRVNGVAPGPIWTPLIPSTFTKKEVTRFGADVPMKRPGEPSEVAPCYTFLASDDSSYISGQILHPNGGAIVNG